MVAMLRRPRALLGVVLGGVALSIVAEIVAQCLPPHYSPVSQTESALAVGPYGFLEACNLFVRGLVTVAFLGAFVQIVPAPLRSRRGVVLLGVSAAAKIVLAFAPTDLTPRPETVHGIIHAVAAVASFLSGAIGQLLLAIRVARGRDLGTWGVLFVAIAWISVALAVVDIATLPIASRIGVWGLLERALSALLLGGLVLESLELWPHAPAHAANRPFAPEEAVSRGAEAGS
jgi:hypothetical protein